MTFPAPRVVLPPELVGRAERVLQELLSDLADLQDAIDDVKRPGPVPPGFNDPAEHLALILHEPFDVAPGRKQPLSEADDIAAEIERVIEDAEDAAYEAAEGDDP